MKYIYKCVNSTAKIICVKLKIHSEGTTEDYVSHICDTINAIITSYATYHRVDYLHAKSSIKEHTK